jgi:hypothetical protein
MAELQASVALGCSAETAAKAWEKFDLREEIGRGMGPEGQVEETLQERYAEDEGIRFEDKPDGTSVVTLSVKYDDAADETSFRAEVEDELARYRAFVESGDH